MKMMKKKWLGMLAAAVLSVSLGVAAAGTGGELTVRADDDSDAKISIDASTKKLDKTYNISEYLYGLFLEDINYSVDGGLYAEMVENRSFEYGEYAIDGPLFGWEQVGDTEFYAVNGESDGTALHTANTTYLRIQSGGDSLSGVRNGGFTKSTAGMAIQKDGKYDFSVFMKGAKGTEVTVRLSDKETVYAEAKLTVQTENTWAKYEAELTASETVAENLGLELLTGGSVDIDMVSLFPQDTYKGKENGLRKDLATLLEDMTPKFLRFPGGCVVEGKSLATAYSWKDSIGDGAAFNYYNATAGKNETTVGNVATRKQGVDIWSNLTAATDYPYYMTYGVGFYEYFDFCEDLGCLGVPILNCGLSCIPQSPKIERAVPGTPAFEKYVQDALDLVEFCRGDASTKWGKVRIDMGHEEPFELRYIGIGNEQWSEEYFENYGYFVEAFNEQRKTNPALYEGIELILANGPDNNDTYGWDKLEDNKKVANYAGMVDEHYYESNDWLLSNTDRYDIGKQNMTMGSQGFRTRDYYTYDHDGTKVFIGEYASNTRNIWYGALCEAAFMTGIERNGDVIEMAAYAPLFAAERTQWNPDMIYFGNDYNYVTVNYYVQKLFMNNQGRQLLKSSMETEEGIYYVASVAENGDVIIKIVNTEGGAVEIDIEIDNLAAGYGRTATCTRLYSTEKNVTNTKLKENVAPETFTVDVEDGDFDFTAYSYSVNIIRISKGSTVNIRESGCGTVAFKGNAFIGGASLLLLAAGVVMFSARRKQTDM